ncbi:MAG TPA: TIM barrel protein [Chloroflexota bacterium]
MSAGNVVFSVFTKPWKMPLADLGGLVGRLGFRQIELPVRPGYQVEPTEAAAGLPAAARLLADLGVRIASVAGAADEAMIAACAEAEVPMLRVMAPIGPAGYLETVEKTRRELDSLVPLLDRYGVRLGVQNHCGRFVSNAMGLRHLLRGYESRHVCAVWDAAHNALDGEEPELALDIVWSHLGMVNLKNAFWRRTTGPEAEVAEWHPYWTSARQGLASWPRVAAELRRRGYSGTVCLTAEYSDEASVERLIAEDLAYARALFGE